ncbi:MAG: glucose 1-dehydrogenase [Polyangiaceae bacterium]|nr:glucose 1-dehydrogenase [Polyangiaceae bacterium]
MPILDRFRLDGCVALVTGASRGIGRASCLALAEAGADIVLAARRPDLLEEAAGVVRSLGRRALAVPTDVADPKALDALASRALDEFGRVDVLVNNAGGTAPLVALALSDEELDAAFRFNVTSGFRLARTLAPHMKRGGRGAIVNISSAMSHLVDSGFVAYGTAKAAVDHMTRLLAYEWAPHVRVNAIAAGATLTDALEAVAGMDELRQRMVERHPMARLGTPEDVAAAVLYLATPASAWVTGKVFEIDGGAVASTWPMRIPSGLDDL